MTQQIDRSTILPSTDLGANELKVFNVGDVPVGATTESLLYSLLVQQSQLFETVDNIHTRLTSIESDIEQIKTDTSTIKDDTIIIRADLDLIEPNIEQLKDDTIIIRTELHGIQATGTSNIISGNIDSIDVTDVGSGYFSVPTVTITGDGSEAEAEATIENGKVIEITITNPGTGYTNATIIIESPGELGDTLREHSVIVRTELSEITMADPDAHTTSICLDASDARNPQTLKDYLALVKTEVRRMDDCERDCIDAPWSVDLALEMSATQDMDSNNMIFGFANNASGFIFNETFDKYPTMLANTLTEEVYNGWSGTKLTFSEYETSLPDGCHKDQFSSWLSITGY